MARPDRFDAAYYERYYEDPATRVGGRESFRRLGDFICSYLRYLHVEVGTVLDLGCGMGMWRPAIRRHFPTARYRGVEISEEMCARHGWEQGSVVDLPCEEPTDLVICHGVLQYLTAREASRAITNLGRHTGQALYLEVLTRQDWDDNVDQRSTDGDVYLRDVGWYRERLARHFVSAGGGLFVPRGTEDVVLFELEKAE